MRKRRRRGRRRQGRRRRKITERINRRVIIMYYTIPVLHILLFQNSYNRLQYIKIQP